MWYAVGLASGSYLAASLVSVVVFTNRPQLLRDELALGASWLMVLVLTLLGVSCFARWWRRWRERHAAALVASFLLALVGLACLHGDSRALARSVVQLLIVWLPLTALLNARAIAHRWRDAVALAVSCAACLLALHWIGPVVLRRLVMPFYNLDIDHRPKPLHGGANEDGIFSPYTSADFRSEDLNLIFVGDSFTANHRLPHEQRMPTLVEHLLQSRAGATRVRVANFGWVSSSPILQARQLKDIGAKYKPDVVVQFFDFTDVWDDLQVEARLKRRGLDGQVTISQALLARLSMALAVTDIRRWLRNNSVFAEYREKRKAPADRYFFLAQPLEMSEPFFEPAWSGVLETRSVARVLGARYVLFIVPRYQLYNPLESPDDPERPLYPASDTYFFEIFRYFDKQAKTVDFPIHSLLEDFRHSNTYPLCFRNDGHWDVLGNRVAAEAVASYLIDDGVLNANR